MQADFRHSSPSGLFLNAKCRIYIYISKPRLLLAFNTGFCTRVGDNSLSDCYTYYTNISDESYVHGRNSYYLRQGCYIFCHHQNLFRRPTCKRACDRDSYEYLYLQHFPLINLQTLSLHSEGRDPTSAMSPVRFGRGM